jgi:signal peptidase
MGNKVLKTIEWLVFIALMAIAIIAASPLLPTKGWASFYVVVSGSMEPSIPTGSLILVRQTDTRNLAEGRVIAFTSPSDPNKIITHRIDSVSRQPGGSVAYRTKGDNNNAPDNWTVLPEQIKGAYAFHVPYIGYAIAWSKTPLGFAAVVGVPALLFVIMQIRKIRQGIHEEVQKRTEKALREKSDREPREEQPIRRVGPTALAVVLAIGVSLSTVHTAHAVFSSTVTISGITLQVEHAKNPCANGHHLWPDAFNHPPFSAMGVTSLKESWMDPYFDWDGFWEKLGIEAPKACTIPVAPSPFTPPPFPTMPPLPSMPPTPSVPAMPVVPTPHGTPVKPSDTPTPAPTIPQSSASATNG